VIKSSDFLRLDFTPDLTQGGISCACQSLPHLYAGAGNAACNHLRYTVAQVAVELALRRHLVAERIPFQVRAAVPFTDPSRFDISLLGHRCDVRTFLISNPKQILSIQTNPGLLLEAPALVPLDQYSVEGQSGQDLLVFVFVLGTTAGSPVGDARSRKDSQPTYLVHLMPGSWAHPRSWIPLGPLVLKSEDPGTLELEVGGQDRDRRSLARPVELPPRTRLELADDFHALTYLHAAARPAARLGIRSASRVETRLINPTEWRNIWINGIEILVVGWITREQFRQRARLLQTGSRVLQYGRTRTKNMAGPIADLKPLTRLFERARS
jgi:hypothetical protein